VLSKELIEYFSWLRRNLSLSEPWSNHRKQNGKRLSPWIESSNIDRRFGRPSRANLLFYDVAVGARTTKNGAAAFGTHSLLSMKCTALYRNRWSVVAAMRLLFELEGGKAYYVLKTYIAEEFIKRHSDFQRIQAQLAGKF